MVLKRIWWSSSSVSPPPEPQDDDEEDEEEQKVENLLEVVQKKPLIIVPTSFDEATVTKVIQLPKCLTSLKLEKGPIGGPPVSQFVYASFIRSGFRLEENPGDELFQIDDDLLDHLLSPPSLLTRMSVLRWEMLQAMLVMAGRDSPIFRNKDRYIEALGGAGSINSDDSVNIFRYLVDMVDPLCAGVPVQFPVLKPPELQQLQRLKYNLTQIPFPPPPTFVGIPTGQRILCIDGGGIRGLVPIQLLEALELICTNKQTAGQQYGGGSAVPAAADAGGGGISKISACFDLIAGTSTGGLVALALATNHSLHEIRQVYFKMKDHVFKGYRPYDPTKFDEILKLFFGPETKMSDITGIKVVITAVYGSIQDLKLKLFTNFDEETGHELIWKVARRTTAAPGYFDPMPEDPGRLDGVTEFFDGGLSANNPTMKILTRFADVAKNGIIVSLGTGKVLDRNEPLPKVRLTLQGRTSMFFSGDLDKLATAFINQVTKTDGDLVEDCQKLCDNFGSQFFRLTPTLAEEVALDETCDDKILNMLWHTKAFANQHHLIFHKIVESILPPPSSLSPKQQVASGCCLQ